MSDPVEQLDRLKAALASHYRVDRAIGKGGMATVYLAKDLRNERPVAIKVLEPELTAALGLERFLREIRITARLDHPHIVPLLDSGEADGLLFYVMPYVDGESLRDRLNREKQLPLEDAITISREIADALDFAHRHDVIHRDIKPENILLAAGHARVADFGIARAISTAGGARLTATGIAVGTAEYMSPEQAAGTTDLDGRSDVYALGCVLYEMLAGSPPFSGATIEGILRQHLSAQPSPITDFRPRVPESVVRVLERALAKTPADRFTNATAFAKALETGPSAPRRPLVARKHAFGAALAGLMLLLGGVGISRWLSSASASEEMQPARPDSAAVSVAVLPLANLSRDEGQEYLADGMTEELITTLNKLDGLVAIGHRSMMRFKGSDQPTSEIARILGATHVVDGSVLQVGDSVRITVNLYTAASDAPVWGESFTDATRDVLRLQRRVATGVARQVAVGLTRADRERMAETPTVDPEAWNLYLKGIRAFNLLTTQSSEEAAGYFRQAIARDSSYALAYAGLASARLLPGLDYARARELAQQALALDSSLPEAHVALGLIREFSDWDFGGAEEAFRDAIRVQPGNADAYQEMGMLLMRRGRFVEALRYAREARSLNPLSPRFQSNVGEIYFRQGKYKEALAVTATIIEMDSSSPFGYLLRGRTLTLQGRYQEAIGAYDTFFRIDPSEDFSRPWLGYAYAKSGQREKAREVLKDAEARWKRGERRYAVGAAIVYAGLGDTQQTVRLLEWAVEHRALGFSVDLQGVPEFGFLRDEPRFQALLAKIHLER